MMNRCLEVIENYHTFLVKILVILCLLICILHTIGLLIFIWHFFIYNL